MLEMALASLLSRRLTVALSTLTVALATLLLLGVERVRTETRTSFAQTISGTDLIVGPRTGGMQLLLTSVFHIGNGPDSGVSWASYERWGQDARVAWRVPIALGDSHQGFTVVGTTPGYFTHLRYGEGQALRMAQGASFQQAHDVVLGAQVARQLGYRLGDKLTLSHGAARAHHDGDEAPHEDEHDHAQHPFVVTGILAPTGTPIDRTLHVSLDALTRIHEGWESGSASLLAQTGVLAAAQDTATAPPTRISAFLVGLHQPTAILGYQRAVNQFQGEALQAVMPGVALAELWQLMALAEQALRVLSGFVMLMGLLGMLAALLTGLNERRQEMAILRAVGAQPRHIAALLMGETTTLVSLGIACGLAGLYACILTLAPWLRSSYGLDLPVRAPTPTEWQLMGGTLIAGALIGLLPAWRACRLTSP
ncbi:MAG: ABC transporter permease [Aquabacterium sp.]|nr:ABC transporter permease [Aquabacterium sp.]